MLSAKEIQRVILRECRYRKKIALPNVHMKHWFEADVASFTQVGYWHEYEIKRSRADFHNDKRKSKTVRTYGKKATYKTLTKYQLIEGKYWAAPNRFYYVCEKDLLPLDLIPKWAGLIYIDNGWMTQIRQAPVIHKRQADEKIKMSLIWKAYYRYMDWFLKEGNKK